MKKILFLFVFVMLSISVFAQSDKIHPNLQKILDSDETVRVIVQFTENPGDEHRNILANNNCAAGYAPRHLDLIVADCPGNSLFGLSQAGKVQFIWEDEILSPALDHSAVQINATIVWTNGYNGSGTIVSIIDSGVNISHPAFANQFIQEIDFTTENSTGDFCDHGTHTATVVASINDTYKGIAHGAKFFNAKAGKKGGASGCQFSSTDIMEAIDWSITNNAQVITMSLGGLVSNCSSSITANYVNQTVIEDNIPIIIAAGNSGPGNQSIWSPACAENSIAVGAVDDNNNIASFSSRGPVVESIIRVKPDVVAPGVGIFTAHNDGVQWDAKDGTSMAAPHAAGIVALMLQAKPGLNQKQIKEILKNTSTDLGYDENTQGEGLVNASAAVDLALNTTPEVFPDSSGLIAYYTSTDSYKPKHRDVFANDTFSAEKTALSIAESSGLSSDLVWVKVVSSPVDNETVMVTLDNQSDINVQVQAYDIFGNVKELTPDAGGFSERRFDATYEQNSGRAIIVYAKNDAVPAYEIWNGRGYSVSGVLENSSSCTANVTWIVAASKPNSNEIAVAYQDADGNYCAQVWNGTAWGNTKSLGNDSGTNSQKFDIAYEQFSGHALAVFETSTEGVIGYCQWDGSNWCSTISTLSDRGKQNDWVKLASQRGSDRILLGAVQFAQSDRDVDAIEWNGIAFGIWKQIDGLVEHTSGVNRMLDVAYIGTSGKGMVVYVDDDADVPSYATCASAVDCFAGTWSSVSTTTSASNNCGEAANLDYVGLSEDPQSDKVLLYAISQISHYKCAQIYDGTSWGSWNSNLGSGSASLDGEDVAAAYDII